MLVNMACFFLVALGLYLTADEIDMSKKNAREDGSQPPFFETFEELKEIFSSPGNALWAITSGLMMSQFFVMSMWSPYYFT